MLDEDKLEVATAIENPPGPPPRARAKEQKESEEKRQQMLSSKLAAGGGREYIESDPGVQNGNPGLRVSATM